MKSLSVTTAIALHLAMVFTCGALKAAEKDDPRRAIEEANAAFAAAFGKGDAKGVAEMYTEGGQLLPPNEEIVAGRAAIEKFWRAAMAGGIVGLELTTTEIESFGDSIVELGKATVFGKGAEVLDQGKYVVLWKKVGGKWKLHRDCWNSSRGAPKK